MANPNEPPTREELCHRFQDAVSQYLVRHQSIIDVISKLQEASSRTNRAISKSITACGCVKVQAEKQQIPEKTDYKELKEHMSSHLVGRICEDCQDILEDELGKNLFYLAALCDVLELDLEDIMQKELERMMALGIFNLR